MEERYSGEERVGGRRVGPANLPPLWLQDRGTPQWASLSEGAAPLAPPCWPRPCPLGHSPAARPCPPHLPQALTESLWAGPGGSTGGSLPAFFPPPVPQHRLAIAASAALWPKAGEGLEGQVPLSVSLVCVSSF